MEEHRREWRQRREPWLHATGVELGADQSAAVRGVLTSGAQVESLVGPAGTGKSFVVGLLARAWQDPTRWAGPAAQGHRAPPGPQQFQASGPAAAGGRVATPAGTSRAGRGD